MRAKENHRQKKIVNQVLSITLIVASNKYFHFTLTFSMLMILKRFYDVNEQLK